MSSSRKTGQRLQQRSRPGLNMSSSSSKLSNSRPRQTQRQHEPRQPELIAVLRPKQLSPLRGCRPRQ